MSVPLFSEYVTRYGAGIAVTVLITPVVLPDALIAAALNLYVVPFVRPVMSQLNGEAEARTVQVLPVITVVPSLANA